VLRLAWNWRSIYEEYKLNDRNAERSGKASDGVHGIWHWMSWITPQRFFNTKDPMHTMSNVIKDSIKVIRPSKNKFKNRVETLRVRVACKAKNIFPERIKISQTHLDSDFK
jgi:hypothetical protein